MEGTNLKLKLQQRYVQGLCTVHTVHCACSLVIKCTDQLSGHQFGICNLERGLIQIQDTLGHRSPGVWSIGDSRKYDLEAQHDFNPELYSGVINTHSTCPLNFYTSDYQYLKKPLYIQNWMRSILMSLPCLP